MGTYETIPESDSLAAYEGKPVSIRGCITRTPWQHLIKPLESHPNIAYVDVGRDQIVIYSKTPLPDGESLEIRGTVIRLVGTTKRPGSDEEYSELQLVADEWSTCKGQSWLP